MSLSQFTPVHVFPNNTHRIALIGLKPYIRGVISWVLSKFGFQILRGFGAKGVYVGGEPREASEGGSEVGPSPESCLEGWASLQGCGSKALGSAIPSALRGHSSGFGKRHEAGGDGFYWLYGAGIGNKAQRGLNHRPCCGQSGQGAILRRRN